MIERQHYLAGNARTFALWILLLTAGAIPTRLAAQRSARPTLGRTQIDDLTSLVMFEDRRQFDSAALARLLDERHPEVRRHAALTVARLGDKRGVALLRRRPLDADTALAATVVFAVGQLRDTNTVAWFDSLLSSPRTSSSVAAEAATALGKIRTAASREVLARFLARSKVTPRTTNAMGEALLSIGRATSRGDLSPILQYTHSANEELRWRATWALFRPRDPAAVPALLALSSDQSALVRSWAVRGLTKAQVDSASLGAKAESRLLEATRDADRRVRTEAIRTLGTWSDSSSVRALLLALQSPDSWLSVSAAESLARIRATSAIAPLIAATAVGHPCALRITALQSLQQLAPRQAIEAAEGMARDTVTYCRTIAVQALARDTTFTVAGGSAGEVIEALLDDPSAAMRLVANQAHWTVLDFELGLADRRSGRARALASPDAIVRAGALRPMATWADTSDLPLLLSQYERAQRDSSPVAASAAVAAIGGVQRRLNRGATQFLSRFSAPSNASLRRDIDRALGAAARQAWPPAPLSNRTADDYRHVVEQWIVPAYNGALRPTARWETPRGAIDVELYPADAPLAVDDFVRTMQSGAMIGTEFTRVVPDFVDQQRTIRDGNVLRDEVNRHRLTRANLSWASAGLDTGSPGYTLNHTPQPHNEGDFTSLGRVIRGMDAVDRIELGDRILGARMLTPGSTH